MHKLAKKPKNCLVIINDIILPYDKLYLLPMTFPNIQIQLLQNTTYLHS